MLGQRMVPSDEHDPGPERVAPDEIDRQSHPLALRLVTPAIDGPNYATLRQGNDYWQTALWAYQAQSKLSGSARVGLFRALAQDWPTTRGERRKREHRALLAADLAAAGHDLDEIAYRLSDLYGRPQLDTVRRWIKDGQAMHRPGRDFDAYIEAVGTDTRPAALTLAQSMARPPKQATLRLAEHEARTAARRQPA
jgi:hypothetical protein